MGLSYDTALISTAADVARLTGVHALGNAFTSGDATLEQFLLEAHRWVFERVRGAGTDPAKLANGARLARAEAFYALSLIAEAGYLQSSEPSSVLADRYHARAKEEVDSFRPELESGDEPRRISEGVPVVGHMDGDGLVFGGGLHGGLPSVF